MVKPLEMNAIYGQSFEFVEQLLKTLNKLVLEKVLKPNENLKFHLIIWLYQIINQSFENRDFMDLSEFMFVALFGVNGTNRYELFTKSGTLLSNKAL